MTKVEIGGLKHFDLAQDDNIPKLTIELYTERKIKTTYKTNYKSEPYKANVHLSGS